MDLVGIFGGTVESNQDPEQIGRLKVRVPHVYGSLGDQTGSITTNNLPWALSAGLPSGFTANSGGCTWLPDVGDQVLVQFLDGEPEKPVWTWFTQTPSAAENFPLYQYGADGAPSTGAWTRYGHSVQFTESTLSAVTAEGYQLVLDDSDGVTGGACILNTVLGQALEMNDFRETVVLQGADTEVLAADNLILNAGVSMLLNVGSHLSILCSGALLTINDDGSVTLNASSGASLIVDPAGNMVLMSAAGDTVSIENNQIQVNTADGTGISLQPGQATVNAQNVAINAGTVALGAEAISTLTLTDPLVAWLNTHIHSNGDDGSPTGPAIVPVQPEEIGSTTAIAS